MADTPEKASAKPVVSIRYGNVSVAAFAKEAKDKSGETFETHDVSLRRTYKKSDGSWAHTHTLRRNDLLAAAQALTECYQYLAGSRERLEVEGE